MPPGTIIVAAVLSLALAGGLLARLFRRVGRGGRDEWQPAWSAVPAAPAVWPATEAASAPFALASASGPITSASEEEREEKELLRVSRTGDGELGVFVQGRPYRRLREINDPRLGRDTIEALQAILAFAEGWIHSIQQWAAEAEVAKEAETEGERPPRRLPRVAPRQAEGLSGLTERPGVREPGRMLDPLPLVEEVNDLVQRRLRERPDMAHHLITLTTGLDGGLRIYVDQQAFQTLDDLTDPEVRSLIRDAIREWEGG